MLGMLGILGICGLRWGSIERAAAGGGGGGCKEKGMYKYRTQEKMRKSEKSEILPENEAEVALKAVTAKVV